VDGGGVPVPYTTSTYFWEIVIVNLPDNRPPAGLSFCFRQRSIMVLGNCSCIM